MRINAMILGRTDLRKGVSGAKFDAESDFEVRLAVAPQKPSQNCKKPIFRPENFAFFFRRQKMKCWESSETRFGQVWRQSEPSLRGKRPFEVSKKNRNSPNF